MTSGMSEFGEGVEGLRTQLFGCMFGSGISDVSEMCKGEMSEFLGTFKIRQI